MGVTADGIRQQMERVEREAPPLSDGQVRDVAVLLSAGKVDGPAAVSQ